MGINRFFVLLIAFLPFSIVAQKKDYRNRELVVTSPSGSLKFILKTKNERLVYQINEGQSTIIEPSFLGLESNGISYGENAIIGKSSSYNINESYAFRGIHSLAKNKCNALKIEIISSGEIFVVEVRVFNDGVAFRYLINKKDSAVITKDISSFSLPAESVVWSQSNIKYYEGKYAKNKIADFHENDLAGPPITIELANKKGFVAITEAGLTDFAGMSLRYIGSGMFTANLSGSVKLNGKFVTPWRVIEIGKSLNELVNCDIISNLSKEADKKLFPKGYATDWIKPGRSVWSWLANDRSITLANMKKFTDKAAELGFEYNLVDEGWANWKDTINHRDNWQMMKELVDYSATKSVKIWVWKAYPDRKGIDGIKDPQKRIIFFKKCQALGIAGLKIDFFDSESQEIIRFYQDALRDAATYHLMLDFHGANKPTGESRTWPNEMTREAIRGLENRPPWAESNTVLPFTRYLAGHADFTPIHFGNRLGEVSWSHQIASAIIFTSPFLCFGADPQTILDNPNKALIQSIPSTWDETIVLPESVIGELVIYARRKGNTWFLAAMNGLHQTKTITIPLNFLKNGSYQLYSTKDDSEKQANSIIETKQIYSKDELRFVLNGEGGYVARFDKK